MKPLMCMRIILGCIWIGLLAVDVRGQVEAEKPPVEDSAQAEDHSADQRVDELKLLAAVGQRMSQVQKLLVQGETAGEAQQIQREIIADLQRLLDQKSEGNSQSQSKTEEQKSDQNEQSTDAELSGKTGRQNSEQTEGTDQAGTADQTVMSKEFQDKIWGHLPDRLRDQMRNSEAEKFLPKYERMIRAYYRRLAAQMPNR